MSDSIQYKDIPIIFVSAKDSGEDILMGFNSGAFDYITKPVDERILRARIDSVLKHSKKRESTGKNNLQPILLQVYITADTSWKEQIKNGTLSKGKIEFFL